MELWRCGALIFALHEAWFTFKYSYFGGGRLLYDVKCYFLCFAGCQEQILVNKCQYHSRPKCYRHVLLNVSHIPLVYLELRCLLTCVARFPYPGLLDHLHEAVALLQGLRGRSPHVGVDSQQGSVNLRRSYRCPATLGVPRGSVHELGRCATPARLSGVFRGSVVECVLYVDASLTLVMIGTSFVNVAVCSQHAALDSHMI